MTQVTYDAGNSASVISLLHQALTTSPILEVHSSRFPISEETAHKKRMKLLNISSSKDGLTFTFRGGVEHVLLPTNELSGEDGKIMIITKDKSRHSPSQPPYRSKIIFKDSEGKNVHLIFR